MTLAHLEWKTLGLLVAVSASIVTGRSLEARSQSGADVPVVSNDPTVQRNIETLLARAASVRLDPYARVSSLDLRDTRLKDVIDAVTKAGGVSVRYASGVTGLDTPSNIAVSDQTVEDALRGVLTSHGLTFQATGAKAAFIYPDTPADRERYTVSNRVFALAHADPTMLAQDLNRALRSPTEPFQPMILTVQDSRTMIVRATPEVMARAAAWIAEHDKDQ